MDGITGIGVGTDLASALFLSDRFATTGEARTFANQKRAETDNWYGVWVWYEDGTVGLLADNEG